MKTVSDPTHPRVISPPTPQGRVARQADRPPRRLLSILLACSFLFGAALTGCADVSSQVRPQTTSDGLVVARDTRRSILWVRPDHHLGRYDSVLVKVGGFMYAKGQDALSSGQEERIGEMLQQSFSQITASGPVRSATKPGSCTVTINIGLKDLRLHTSDYIGSSASFVSSFGSATMVVEFRDSMTDLPLLRYMENQGLGSGRGTGHTGANLYRLGMTLGDLVTSMIAELQTIVPTTTSQKLHSCHGGIYALTGRS